MIIARAAPETEKETETESDVIIVGAGAVGLVMAADLARQGYRVRLLEAGAATLSERSQRLFEQARDTGHPLPGLHVGRFRMLGGATNFWGGQLLRLEPHIFAPRGWVHSQSGWPIPATAVDPFYDRVLDMLGMGHTDTDDEAIYRRFAIQPPNTGSALDLFLTRWAPEPNLVRHFEAELRRATNLLVHLETPVANILVDGDRGEIRGVVCLDSAGRSHAFRARAVILAAGTIEIVRLLGAPLVDGRDAPWSRLPALGVGFMDHLDCTAGETTILDRRRFHDLFDSFHIDGIKYHPKLRLSAATQAENRLLDVSGRFSYSLSLAQYAFVAKTFAKSFKRGYWVRNAKNRTMLASAAGGTGSFIAAPAILARMALRYLRHRRTYNPAAFGVRFRLTAEQRMMRSSRVLLRPERDETGLPMADVEWRIDGAEIDSMAVFAESVRAFLRTEGLADLEIDPLLAARDPAFLQRVEDSNHHMGGARMSGSRTQGVVDADLCVHGTRNLFVAGAAVFPSCGAANPTFAAMALGLRLCRHLQATGMLEQARGETAPLSPVRMPVST